MSKKPIVQENTEDENQDDHDQDLHPFHRLLKVQGVDTGSTEHTIPWDSSTEQAHQCWSSCIGLSHIQVFLFFE